MHPPQIKARALELVAQGLNDCEISRRLGIPRGTIRDWRRPRYVPRTGPTTRGETCLRCWRAMKPIRLSPPAYAELLAVYLGDGSISIHARTQRLRIYLDSSYSQINAETEALLKQGFPANKVGIARPSPSPWSGRADSWIVLSLYSSHLTCLFPQHGRGPKHKRPIVLETWQEHILREHPWPFIRGCIRTDGCAFINHTDIHRPTPYEYLTYDFTNMSKDIVDLFVAACERVNVFTRVTRRSAGGWDARINRRESVALMLEHVGLKQ